MPCDGAYTSFNTYTQVRKMAIEHITSFTTNSEALEYFRADESKVIVQLQALCHDEMVRSYNNG